MTPTLLSAETVESSTQKVITTLLTPEVVEEIVGDYFSDIPIMSRVAECESRFRHLNSKGDILRGEENPDDLGVMQINEYYHGDTAMRKGINLHTLVGNLTYARYLYDKEGTGPWNASKRCWNKK